MTKFNIRLRELRKSKALSQQKLADIVGMSKSTINMYERGEREPGLEMLESFADFFNVDLDYLLGKTDVPRNNLIIADQVYTINNYPNLDNEPLIIRRLRKGTEKMDEKQQEKMMKILNESFKGLFDEDD